MRVHVLRSAALLLAAPFTIGCLGDGAMEDSSAARAGRGDDDDVGGECAKIEDGDIGVIGIEIDVGNTSVRIDTWTPKVGEPDEYVGFSFSTSGGRVSYRVKAGGEVYTGEGTAWSHPNGDQGPGASAISHIEFCEDDPAGDPSGGGDENDGSDGDEGGGGSGDCADPDGCDPGTSEPPIG